jgi:hypothetical protein
MSTSGESLVTVFASGNRIGFETAKILLRDAGIEFFSLGDGVQEFIGLGGLGTGGNLATGPMKIQVRAEDEAEAMMVLEEMEQDVPEALEQDDDVEGEEE